MKTLLLVFFLAQQALAVETVKNLDIEKYLGLWHQIATIPQTFSKDCVSNTTAEYELAEKQRIKVTNSCVEADGKINTAIGRARVNKEFNESSKLEVTFVKLVGWLWSAAGDYWVIALDDNYQWSVVGHPELDYLWILSREKTMSGPRLKILRNKIESVGYDSCDILMSANDANSYQGSERLCDLNL